jgi:hypothetical protein
MMKPIKLVDSYEHFDFFLEVSNNVSDFDIEVLASISLFSTILKKFLQFGKRVETGNEYLRLRHCMLVNKLIKDYHTSCCRMQAIGESYLEESS